MPHTLNYFYGHLLLIIICFILTQIQSNQNIQHICFVLIFSSSIGSDTFTYVQHTTYVHMNRTIPIHFGRNMMKEMLQYLINSMDCIHGLFEKIFINSLHNAYITLFPFQLSFTSRMFRGTQSNLNFYYVPGIPIQKAVKKQFTVSSSTIQLEYKRAAIIWGQ